MAYMNVRVLRRLKEELAWLIDKWLRGISNKVIVKSHYEEVIIVITRVRGGAEDECNNNDNLRV